MRSYESQRCSLRSTVNLSVRMCPPHKGADSCRDPNAHTQSPGWELSVPPAQLPGFVSRPPPPCPPLNLKPLPQEAVAPEPAGGPQQGQPARAPSVNCVSPTYAFDD